MSARTTTILLLLVAAIGAALWRDPDSRTMIVALLSGEQPRPTPEQVIPLVALEPGDIVGLELRAGSRHFVVERTDDTWKGPLVPGAVEEFLANLPGVGRLDHIPMENRDLDEFGLEAPERSVVLVPRAPADPVRVDIGKSNPATTAVYTRINRVGPVILAGSVLVWEVDKLADRVRPDSVAAPQP